MSITSNIVGIGSTAPQNYGGAPSLQNSTDWSNPIKTRKGLTDGDRCRLESINRASPLYISQQWFIEQSLGRQCEITGEFPSGTVLIKIGDGIYTYQLEVERDWLGPYLYESGHAVEVCRYDATKWPSADHSIASYMGIHGVVSSRLTGIDGSDDVYVVTFQLQSGGKGGGGQLNHRYSVLPGEWLRFSPLATGGIVPAGQPVALSGAPHPSQGTVIQSPERELTPEEKLIEYRRSLRKFLYGGN